MPQQNLNGSQVCPRFQEMRRVTVAQRMHGDVLAKIGCCSNFLTILGNCAGANRIFFGMAWKEPLRWLIFFPILAQQHQQLIRQWDVAILFAFSQADVERHAVAVNILDSQVGEFRNAKPSGISAHEHGPLFQ